jgi:hypothetical protein
VARKRAVLTTLIERIEVRVDGIDIRFRPPRLAAPLDGPDTSPQGANDEETELLSALPHRSSGESLSAVQVRGCRPTRQFAISASMSFLPEPSQR